MKLNKKSTLWAGAGALILCGGLAGIALAGGEQEHEVAVGISAPLLVKAINAASAAKAGDISEVEVESEKGHTTVDVDVLAADGQKYEVSVEAATGKVLSVEKDDEGKENEAKEDESKEGKDDEANEKN